LTFAVNIVCLRIQKSGSPMDNVFFGNLITALIGIPFMFGAPPSPMSWVALTLLGFFQLGLSYILFAIAIKKVTALEGALIPIIEPILNPIIVAVLIREIPGKWSIVGGVIVISSVAIKFLFSIIRPPQGDVKGDGVSIE
jgi:drug/metabolite transporter (DMT)-like permease